MNVHHTKVLVLRSYNNAPVQSS